MEKIMKKLGGFVILLLILNLVSSFGVSSPHWETNPLTMAKGEKKTIEFNLQNGLGEEDVVVKIEVIKGKEIVKLKKDSYKVKAGTTDTMVPLEIEIPRNATEPYPVMLVFKTAPDSEGGPITMGVGAKIVFDVLVSDEVVEEPSLFEGRQLFIILIGVGILLILVIVFFVLRRKKIRKRR